MYSHWCQLRYMCDLTTSRLVLGGFVVEPLISDTEDMGSIPGPVMCFHLFSFVQYHFSHPHINYSLSNMCFHCKEKYSKINQGKIEENYNFFKWMTGVMRKGPLFFDVKILRKRRQSLWIWKVKIAVRKPGNSFVGCIRSTFFVHIYGGDLSNNFVVICMALIGQEHSF